MTESLIQTGLITINPRQVGSVILFIILTFVTIASVGLKQRSVVKARTTYEEIKWAREDWVPLG